MRIWQKWLLGEVTYNLFTSDVNFLLWRHHLRWKWDVINVENFHEVLRYIFQILATPLKVIFSFLNLKPDNGFLPYNVPEAFNKTGDHLTNIIIAWDEFKPRAVFFGNNGTYIYCVLEWNWRPSTIVGACVKNLFKSLE